MSEPVTPPAYWDFKQKPLLARMVFKCAESFIRKQRDWKNLLSTPADYQRHSYV